MKLRELTLATILTLTGCSSTPPEPVPQIQAEQTIDHVLQDAITYYETKDYGKVQGLLEQHRKYQTETNKEFSLSNHVMLALAYAKSNRLSESETELWQIMGRFRQNPESIERVQTELAEFFTSSAYKEGEKQLSGYTFLIPRLHGVLGFLKIAQHEYELAGKHFKQAKKHFEKETIESYTMAIHRLILKNPIYAAVLKEMNE